MTTPSDLGPRARLLVDKHANYIRAFEKVCSLGGFPVVWYFNTLASKELNVFTPSWPAHTNAQ